MTTTRIDLARFDGEASLGMRIDGPVSAEGPTRLVPGAGDVLSLRLAPRRMPWRPEPQHHLLLVQLSGRLADAQQGDLLLWDLAVYQEGAEQRTFLSASGHGELRLLERSGPEAVVDVRLSFDCPLLDAQGQGAVRLVGTVELRCR